MFEVLPILDVQNPTSSECISQVFIKKKFAFRKKDEKSDFGKLFVANLVTLATRVRLDIMSAMAKKFETTKDMMFVNGITSRPVLQVKPRYGSRPPVAFTFVDAVAQFGKGIKDAKLVGVYRRAGDAFTS